MRRAARVVVGTEVLVEIRDDVLVRGLLDARDLLAQLLLGQRALDVLEVGLLGETELRDRLHKSVLVAAVALDGFLPRLVEVLLRHLDAVVLLGLHEQVLANNAVDDVLAVALGREALLGEIRRPVLVALVRALAQAHDLLGHGVLFDVHAVDGGCHAARELVILLVLHLVEHARARHGAHGEQHGGDADCHQHDLTGLGELLLALCLDLALAGLGGLRGIHLGRLPLNLGAFLTNSHGPSFRSR